MLAIDSPSLSHASLIALSTDRDMDDTVEAPGDSGRRSGERVREWRCLAGMRRSSSSAMATTSKSSSRIVDARPFTNTAASWRCSHANDAADGSYGSGTVIVEMDYPDAPDLYRADPPRWCRCPLYRVTRLRFQVHGRQ